MLVRRAHMAYHPDTSAAFVGMERIKGTIGGRCGTVVLHADPSGRVTLTLDV